MIKNARDTCVDMCVNGYSAEDVHMSSQLTHNDSTLFLILTKTSPHNMPMQVQRGGGGVARTHSQPGITGSTTLRLPYLRERPGTLCTGGWVILGVGLPELSLF